MSSPSGNPRLEAYLTGVLEQQIPALAVLYDRWANSLDPDAPGIDEAEKAFHQTVLQMFDSVTHWGPNDEVKSINLRDFRRYVILKCKKHLAAASKPPTL